MKEIIAPVSKEALIAELTPDKLMRKTNKADNEIYIVTYQDSPNVMREIGRVREITFRDAGGGTGEEIDIDEYDTCSDPYKQLIVWDPQAHEIIGGYRYILCNDLPVDKNGVVQLATTHLFNFSNKFIKEYLPLYARIGALFCSTTLPVEQGRSKSLVRARQFVGWIGRSDC